MPISEEDLLLGRKVRFDWNKLDGPSSKTYLEDEVWISGEVTAIIGSEVEVKLDDDSFRRTSFIVVDVPREDVQLVERRPK